MADPLMPPNRRGAKESGVNREKPAPAQPVPVQPVPQATPAQPVAQPAPIPVAQPYVAPQQIPMAQPYAQPAQPCRHREALRRRRRICRACSC